MSNITRGDRVRYDGKVFYAAPNGSSVKLYRTAAMSGKPVCTPATKSVVKVKFVPKKKPPKKPVAAAAAVADSTSSDDSDGESPVSRIVGHRFFYVAVDLDKRSDAVKIGITNDLSKRLRSYRTANPDYQFVLVVNTGVEQAARPIETAFKKRHAAQRVGQSEVFRMRAREVEDWLVAEGWRRGADGNFGKK